MKLEILDGGCCCEPGAIRRNQHVDMQIADVGGEGLENLVLSGSSCISAATVHLQCCCKQANQWFCTKAFFVLY